MLCFQTPLAVIKDKNVKNQDGSLKVTFLTFSINPYSTFNLIGPCNRNPNTQSHKDKYAQTTDI